MDKNYIAIVFDGPPSHEAGRFVEVNDSHGKSIDIGTWVSRGDGSWELRIAVDKLKDDNDMTVDTRREAVEKLIERLCNMSNDSDWSFYGKPAVDTLAALLYERDTQNGLINAQDYTLGEQQQAERRIRDLETDTLQALLDERERLTNANANIAAKWWLDVDRAERAEQRIRELEADLSGMRSNASLFARQRDREMAEHDRLAAKLDAVKALCEKESGEIRTRYEPEGPYTGYANACDDVLAILADTDEGNEQ